MLEISSVMNMLNGTYIEHFYNQDIEIRLFIEEKITLNM